jgi:hypothetical protein
MLKILRGSDNKHRLEDDSGEQIGWIAGSAIGFREFSTEFDAREAAAAARRSLDAVLSAHYPGWPRCELTADQLRTAHDGAHEWFTDGTIPIARLLRPHPRAYDASYGIEFVLPSFASDGMAVTVAHAVATAVMPYRDELSPATGRPDGRSAVPREDEAPASA